MITRRIAALGFAAVAVWFARSSEAADPWTPVPSSFFGMIVHRTSNSPSVSVGALGKGSCVNWSDIAVSRGVYNWSALDSYVKLAQQKGVDFIYTIDGVPRWAASDTSTCIPSSCNSAILSCAAMPNDINDFNNFMIALVSRYQGQIKYYELWNEPYQEPKITISNLVTLTTNAYNIVRAYDPSAQILTPSMSGDHPDYATNYFAAGGPTGVDIASLHAEVDPYNLSAQVPEGVTADRYLLGPLLPVLSQYLPGKPLWDTEGSWNVTGIGNVSTAAQQAAFIARWYILHWSSGFGRAYWYAWDDPEWGTLMPSMLGSSVPATAFQQVQNWLVGKIMSSPCSVMADWVTWTCKLMGPSGYHALIVWNTAGNGFFTPQYPAQYSQYRDLSGNVKGYAGYAGASVATGIQPILLEN